MRSWKTTVAGVATALGAVSTAVAALLDSDPATVPNWPMVATLLGVAWGLIMAKDETPAPPAPPKAA